MFALERIQVQKRDEKRKNVIPVALEGEFLAVAFGQSRFAGSTAHTFDQLLTDSSLCLRLEGTDSILASI